MFTRSSLHKAYGCPWFRDTVNKHNRGFIASLLQFTCILGAPSVAASVSVKAVSSLLTILHTGEASCGLCVGVHASCSAVWHQLIKTRVGSMLPCPFLQQAMDCNMLHHHGSTMRSQRALE